MNKIIEIILCGGIVATELIIMIVAALMIQFIMYKLFNINLFKLIIKMSRRLERYLNTKLYV